MRQKLFIIIFILINHIALSLQNRVLVAETTVKISSLGSEELYFGFNEGDQVIFNFELIKGKNLKEIEIFEYPNTSIFMDYKTEFINDKSISISKKGIYKFSFKNSAVGVRVCKVKVERIPANTNDEKFNTTVYWKTLTDTNFYLQDEKYIINKDTSYINVANPTVKVHSTTNANGNMSTFNFSLPENTVAWSYYIGVDQSGQEAYEKATKELAKNTAPLLAKIPTYGPLAALALGSASYLSILQTGEDIDFFIVEGDNVNLFLTNRQFYYIKKGKVINDFGRITSPKKGSLHFCFSNDNAVTGVTVTVKVVALTIKENWGIRQVKKYKINSWQEPYLNN